MRERLGIFLDEALNSLPVHLSREAILAGPLYAASVTGWV